MIVLGDHNFRECTQSGFWVIDFWSPSCAPCRVVTPILEELSQGLPEIQFGSVDATTALQSRFAFQISGFPTVVLLKDGRPVDLIFGPHPARVYRSRIAAASAAKP
ncbi:thioredoxin family protein [Deinococcus frigens]|uniref:thioredoxin family protein n=1 Tax=Deinococcus frigens TaxID=249403 RepID=UPI000A03591C